MTKVETADEKQPASGAPNEAKAKMKRAVWLSRVVRTRQFSSLKVDMTVPERGVYTSAQLEQLAESGSLGLNKKGRFFEILQLLDQLHETTDPNLRMEHIRGLLAGVMEWLEKHSDWKKDAVKRQALMDLGDQLLDAPELGIKRDETQRFSEDPQEREREIRAASAQAFRHDYKSRGTKLFDAKAGTTASSEMARVVVEADVDSRALALRYLLEPGAKNNDKSFAAVMTWLKDHALDKTLRESYRVVQGAYLKAREPDLTTDIVRTFGGGTLRTRYLLDKLTGQESPYAGLAFRLGLLGKTWFDTANTEDALVEIEEKYSVRQIEQLLGASDTSTFEGAIAEKLRNDYPRLLEVIKARRLLLKEAQEGKQPVAAPYKSASDYYLCSMIDQLKNASFAPSRSAKFGVKRFSSSDAQRLTDTVIHWAENASPEEKQAVLAEDSQFRKTLNALATKAPKGWLSSFDQSDKQYLLKFIQGPGELPSDSEAERIFKQLEPLAAKQKKKSFAAKRWQHDQIGTQFQALLFDSDVNDPQTAVVEKFNPRQSERWKQLCAQEGEATEQEKREIEEEKQRILDQSCEGLTDLMLQVKMSGDKRKEILGTLYSNGAKGPKYHKLTSMAKSRKPHLDLGKDILKVLEDLEKGSPEHQAIVQDVDLVNALRTQLVIEGTPHAERQWRRIAGFLGVEGALATFTHDEQGRINEGISRSNFKKAHREARYKLGAKPEQRDEAPTPKSVANQLSIEFQKGKVDRSEHRVLHALFLAQKNGLDVDEVLRELGAADEKALQFVKKAGEAKHRSRRLVDSQLRHFAGKSPEFISEEEGHVRVKPISVKDLLIHSLDTATMRRRVSSEEIESLVSDLTPQQVFEEWFGGRRLLQAKDNDPDKFDQLIKKFDVDSDLMQTLDKVLPPTKAIKIKRMLRDKLGEALIEAEDDDAFGLDETTRKRLGNQVKAIANVEYEKQLQTGVQWSSVSSRMLTRDFEAAKYLDKVWDSSDVLKAIEPPSQEEIEEEINRLTTEIEKAEEKLRTAQENFAATKNVYDERVRKIIVALLQATIFAVSMASGVGSAAGVIQLAFLIGATLVQTLIKSAVDKALKGDRAQAEDYFVDGLADQAGALMGLVGANLAFALDVAAIGKFTGLPGKQIPVAQKIFAGPLLEQAKGHIKGVFNDIGSNFVKRMADEKGTDSLTGDLAKLARDAAEGMANLGVNAVKSAPRKYLKGVLLGSASQGVAELAVALGWDEDELGVFRYNNPESVNEGTAAGGRPFESGDARLGFSAEDGETFESWFNGWGMFDASVGKDIGRTEWTGGADWTDVKNIFGEMAKGLKDPRVLTALTNSVVWGTTGVDANKGIKGRLGGMVDNVLDRLCQDMPQESAERVKNQRDELVEQCHRELMQQVENKRDEMLNALQNLGEEAPLSDDELGELSPQQVLDLWQELPRDIGVEELQEFMGFPEAETKAYHAFVTRPCSLTEHRARFADADVLQALNDVDFVEDVVSGRIFLDYDVDSTLIQIKPEDGLAAAYGTWVEIQLATAVN